MTALKASEVDRFVARPDISQGIFLAYGPDTGLVREVAQKLVKSFADGEVVTLDGKELDRDPSRLAVEATTMSLFGGRRVIRVRDAGKGIAAVLTDVVDRADCAIVLEADNLAPRDALRALVESMPKGRTLPCYPDDDRALSKLIRESFTASGVTADADAETTLAEILGNDREVTRRELEKLALYAGPGGTLTRDDVLELCADNAMVALDAIIDAMAGGRASDLEDALSRALAATVSSTQILTMALQHFTQLRRWRTDIDSGKSPRDALENARPRPHFSRKSAIEQQLRLWTDEALAAALARLQLAVAESRKTYDMQLTVLRRALLAVTLQAAER